MDTYHPSLLLINLRNVDKTAHESDFFADTDAVKTADQIVFKLCQEIQNDDYYTIRIKPI